MTAPGDRVAGRYVIGPPLGVGGMGQIWQATDSRLNRDVALKLIRPDRHGDDDAARRRFYREARVLGRLRHPGIPALYDFGMDDADLFIVMELIPDAVCLRDLVAEQAPGLLPVPWAAVIGAQLCAALAAAHRAGLIHRDLTPANVVLTRDGTVRILDFGVAAALTSGDFSEITRPGEAPGSLRYMAPELDGLTKADVRSDLYSVGCVLFELLTGRRVFQSPSVVEEITRHRDEPPPPLTTARDDVPKPLEQLVHALLAKDPAARPTTSTEVFTALLPHARNVPTSTRLRPPRPHRPHPPLHNRPNPPPTLTSRHRRTIRPGPLSIPPRGCGRWMIPIRSPCGGAPLSRLRRPPR